MSSALRRLGLITLLVFAAACSRTTRTGTGEAYRPAVLLFTNQSLDQASVYAIRSGGDVRRIGTVQAGRTEAITLPRDFVTAGSVNIVAVPLASNRALSTGPVSIRPGDRYSVTLPISENVLTLLPAGEP
jgi:hypothetical protein